MPTPQERFIPAVVAHSRARSWEGARTEWDVHDVFVWEPGATEKERRRIERGAERVQATAGRCLCGTRIKNVIVMHNPETDEFVPVGKCCFRHFGAHLPTGDIHAAIRKALADEDLRFAPSTIEWLRLLGIVNDWEAGFYMSIHRKKWLTDKQRAVLERLNRKAVAKLKGKVA